MNKSIEILENAIDAGKRHKEFLEEEIRTLYECVVSTRKKIDKVNAEIKEIEQAIEILEEE